MKHRILACPLLALIAVVAFAYPAAAQVIGNPGDATITVYPVGAHPADVTNVQWAVDNVASPGTVVLKATDMAGNPLAFDFGGTAIGNGGVIELTRADIALTGDGWDDTLDEPKTKIVNGGGPFTFAPSVSGQAMVFAVSAAGVTIRMLAMTTPWAYTGIFIVSFDQVAIDHPVVVERNHIEATNYPVLAQYTAAFPVTIDNNVLTGKFPVQARWVGFTLRPITTPIDYDEPVVPQDAFGNPVRYRFEVTNNVLFKPQGQTGSNLLVWAWSNYYNTLAGADMTDPDLGCGRRVRKDSSSPWVYQCVTGDNGPVLISGNSIFLEVDPESFSSAIELGNTYYGLNHAVVAGNRLFGTCYIGIRQYPYDDDTVILDNDVTGLLANHSIIVSAADTIVTDNILGPVLPRDMPQGLPTPAMLIVSSHYNAGSPAPRPTENSIVMQNDYRQTGVDHTAIIMASRAELQYPTGVGGEVKNNLIFESGNFPPGTGGASNHVMELTMINPDTGLPYVHDNRIVGVSARGRLDPGIGQAVARVNAIRKMLEDREK